MMIVENRFEVRAGSADAVIERFRSPKSVHTFPGFVRMDVLHTVLSEETEEIRVCTTWENEEAFLAWTNSDSFKQAHSRRGEASGSERGEQSSQHTAAAQEPGAQASGAAHAHDASGGHGSHGSSHGGHGSSASGAPASSPILSSKVTKYNVVVTHLPA